MPPNFLTETNRFILTATGASEILHTKNLQNLWSGYGRIVRYSLAKGRHSSVILKHIQPDRHASHPRGWDSDTSNQRKLQSYDVEFHWYRYYASLCDDNCRVPGFIDGQARSRETLLLLEDLDNHYPARRDSLSVQEVTVCLSWLAHFHATFMGHPGEGLWQTGTYWHLATRADEFNAMAEGPVKQAAGAIDHTLNHCQYQTLVHGDAKVANFCFATDRQHVAAVDFQYVGRGCGIKDVVYLLGSCLSGEETAANEAKLLDHYFNQLHLALAETPHAIHSSAIETEWRTLYAIAWTDFYRFLLGWNPGHRKIDRYTQHLANVALASLQDIS